ncbi:helix-turn-helix domain-containing protein [Candidatus Omnitrophota bacterium]
MKKEREIISFGERVRNARKKKKLTAEDLAKKMGVDRTYISKIENKNYFPSSSKIKKLFDSLNDTAVVDAYMSNKYPGFDDYKWSTGFSNLSETELNTTLPKIKLLSYQLNTEINKLSKLATNRKTENQILSLGSQIQALLNQVVSTPEESTSFLAKLGNIAKK